MHKLRIMLNGTSKINVLGQSASFGVLVNDSTNKIGVGH